MIDQWRQFAARLFITGLSAAYLVIRLALHGIAAIYGFFETWSSAPRPLPGSFPPPVAGPVRVIDGFDGVLRRASGLTGQIFHALASPLRWVLEKLAARIATIDTDSG